MRQNRILLADDHAVVRQGLKGLLEQYGYAVCGEAENCDGAYTQWQALRPHLLLLDLDMPGVGGLETIKRILSREAEAKVIVFSMHDDSIYATRAMQAGAKGYIIKTDAPERLLDAIKVVLNGGQYLSVALAQSMAIAQFNKNDRPLDILSPREFEIFRRLANGETLMQIASALHIGYKTTANVQTQIRQKLGIDTTAQLVHLALRLGILQREPENL